MATLLVTGGSGFVGRQVLALLRDRDDVEFVAVGRRRSVEGVRWVERDLLAPGAPSSVIEDIKPTRVLHLAWEATPGSYLDSQANLTWLAASAELLDAFVEYGGRRFVGVGTCLEYDVSVGGRCKESTTPLRPHTLYGACKHAFGSSLIQAGRTLGISAAWSRLFHLYGPHEHPERLVAYVARTLLKRRPAELSGGLQQRDYLSVTEAASALVSILMTEVEGPVNVGSGRIVSVRQVAETIAEICGAEDLLRFGSRVAEDAAVSVLAADVARLTSEVGWRPAFGLEEGLRRTVQWWQRELAP